MRITLLTLLISIILTGCAGTAGTSVPDNGSRPDAVRGSAGQSGETARIPPDTNNLSTAGRTLLEQSREQRQTGNTQLAAATLERAIRIEPEQPQYWLELGQIRLQQGNYPQAEQLGRKALSLSASGSQKAAESTQLIADALRAMGRFEEAQQLSIRY